MSDAAPQEPLKLTSEELVAELGANHYSVTVWRGRWSAVPPESSPLAEFEGDTLWEVGSKALGLVVVPRDDAAELRAACEAAKSALTALNRVQMYGSADMVRDRAKRALDLIDAALAATEGQP